MTRIGINPARDQVSEYQPARLTIAVLVHIPAAIGYHQFRVEIFKLSISSILRHTDHEYDLLIYDNASCPEVTEYLSDLKAQGLLQYLITSPVNIGKMGALKIMFRAAPGSIIAYSDDDVYFYPGWIQDHLEILENYPNVGMVSGLPVLSSTDDAILKTIEFANATDEVKVQTGPLVPEEWHRDHAVSIGRDPDEWMEEVRSKSDRILSFRGVDAYVSANHFQFVAQKDVILRALPETWSGRLMREMRPMDREVDQLGYLRLSTTRRTVQHLGNVLEGRVKELAESFDMKTSPSPTSALNTILVKMPMARRLLQGIYNRLFWILSQPHQKQRNNAIPLPGAKAPPELPIHNNLSAVVVTYNDEEFLKPCLRSLSFCGDLVLVDVGSTDDSVKASEAFGARVFHHDHVPFAEKVHKFAASNTMNDWIILADPDMAFPSWIAERLPKMIGEYEDSGLAMIILPMITFSEEGPLSFGRKGGVRGRQVVFHRERVHIPGYLHYRGFEAKEGYHTLGLVSPPDEGISHFSYHGFREFAKKTARYLPYEAESRYGVGLRFSVRETLREIYQKLADDIRKRAYLHPISIIMMFFQVQNILRANLSLRKFEREKAAEQHNGMESDD